LTTGSPPADTARPHARTIPAADTDEPYAGAVTRAVAFALDVALLNAILFLGGVVVALIVEAFGDLSIDVDALTVGLTAVVWWLAFSLYFSAFWSLTGQTPGMRVMGVRVMTTEGSSLPPRRSLLRVVAMVACAIPLFAGFLPILVNDRRMGLHDRIARTVVRYVEDQPQPPPRSGRR
jgi:uncharacterized RDD family membrane protein YckC